MRICTIRALTVVLVLGLALPVLGQQTLGPETKFSFGVDTTTIVELGLPGLRASDIQVNLDMDQDGHQEFLWVNDYGGGLPSDTLYYAMLWENTGNDAYTPVWWYVFEEEGNNFPAVRATDMDEDGNQEICIAIPAVHKGIGGDPSDDRNPARLFFFEWDGTDNGFPTDEPTYSWNFDVAADSVDIRPASLETGDFDNDGDNELAVGFRRYRSSRGGAVAVVNIDGDLGPFSALPEFEMFDSTATTFATSTSSVSAFEVHVADLDGDGMTEIMSSHFSKVSLVLWENTGVDTYERRVNLDTIRTGDDDSGTWDGLTDWNIDGGNESELFYVSRRGNIYVVPNSGDVSMITPASFNLLFDTGSPNRGSAMGDWDNDGNLDYFVTGGNDQMVYRFEYSGAGDYLDSANWDSSVVYSHTNLSRIWYAKIGEDMDGDGSNELFLTHRQSATGNPVVIVLEYDASTGVAESAIELPTIFSLRQNYPNPFNPETTIPFVLTRRDEVTLTIYNALGQKVRTLLDNRTFVPGSHEVNWDGRDDLGNRVVSGTYIYKIQVGQLIQTRRMTLLK